MKILILSPDYSNRVNWGHQHFRNALLDRFKGSVQYGEGCDFKGSTYLPDILKQLKRAGKVEFDVILFENWKNMRRYTGAYDVEALKVYMVCDYMPDNRGNFSQYNQQLNDFGIDIAVCPTPSVVKNIQDQKELGNLSQDLIPVFLPHAVDTEIFKKRNVDKEYDVMAVFGLVSYVYPRRPEVQKIVTGMKNLRVLTGDWRTGIKHEKYAEAINLSKIFVCVNGINNQVLMKYYECMASGTLLLTNTPKNCGSFGFIPGVHFATWSTYGSLKDAIYFYLENPKQAEKIAKKGMDHVRKNFSTAVIAERFEGLIGRHLWHSIPNGPIEETKPEDPPEVEEDPTTEGLIEEQEDDSFHEM